jgi:V-type H+-transporting ATPase subunit e
MGGAFVVFTLLFLLFGAGGALCAGFISQRYKGLVQVLAPVAAFCMWLSYALIYIAQMNPLILPTRNIKAE